jgi:hypothetical protein
MRWAATFLLAALPSMGFGADSSGAPATQVPLPFSGGHETDPRDHGRPVVLVAGALQVTPEVFRAAFSGVHPAPPGQGGPTPDEARANKRVLLAALGKYGVTNDRLDEVSNRYRYRAWAGELWPTRAASGYATVSNGVVTGFVVTDAGYGYSSPPVVTVPGRPEVRAVATLAFGTDFSRNGSVSSVALAPAGN